MRSDIVAKTYDAAKEAFDRAASRKDRRGIEQAARDLASARLSIMKRQKRLRVGDFARDAAGVLFAPFALACVGLVSLADEPAMAATDSACSAVTRELETLAYTSAACAATLAVALAIYPHATRRKPTVADDFNSPWKV